MCRLAAYFGPAIALEQFMLTPEHSLYKQSWQPKEMQEAKLNADGFGIAWYDSENKASRYRNTDTIWSDPNLADLGRNLKQPLWLASVRSATPGQGNGIDNTQPFLKDNVLFMHNGFIKEFAAVKKNIITMLDDNILANVHGDTDSEYLFALFHQQYLKTNSLSEALKNTCLQCKYLFENTSALINIIVSDGTEIHAVKFSVNAEAPSLYWLEKSPSFSDAIVIASEPLTPDENWQAIDHGQIISIQKDNKICWNEITG